MSKNDELILKLKKQIEEKEISLGKSKRFAPITNCILDLNGLKININTLQKEALIGVLVQINSLAMSADSLGLLDDYNIDGYGIESWVTDLKNKLESLKTKQKEQELRQMKDRLEQLLSQDKKVELELEKIAESLS